MSDIQQKKYANQIALFDSFHFSDPVSEIFTHSYWQSQNALIGQATGRGTTYFFKHGQKEYVLRHYCRGGLIGKLLTDQYLYTGLTHTRAWQEFMLLKKMQSQGLPCPAPAAAQVTRHGLIYRADIILEKIEQAQDLHHILLTQSLTPTMWQQVGQTIAKFHNQQIYHHDLNIHNIMLDKSAKAWLIDFDKCAVKQGQEWKKANIARLKRSFGKEQKQYKVHWQLADWSALLDGYNDALEKAP